MTVRGVDWVTGTIVLWLPVVVVAIFRRSPTAHYSSKAMSSMLRDSEMGSCSVRSAILIGAAGSSSWKGGVMTNTGVDCSTDSGVDC